jgi:predicted GNAT family N-acyltransferase
MAKLLVFKYEDRDLFEKAIQIRTNVFVKELGINPVLECDEFDKTAFHGLMMDDNKALAACRWRETDKGIKLERFAVPKEYRNRGIGSVMLKNVLEMVLPSKRLVYLHSQYTSVNLYLRNGFEIVGEPFEEAGIKHFYMKYAVSSDRAANP